MFQSPPTRKHQKIGGKSQIHLQFPLATWCHQRCHLLRFHREEPGDVAAQIPVVQVEVLKDLVEKRDGAAGSALWLCENTREKL